MDFIALFKDFGFPALVTGVLLWMYATKLEKLTASNELLKSSIDGMKLMMGAMLEKITSNCDDIKELRENTRPRGGRQT